MTHFLNPLSLSVFPSIKEAIQLALTLLFTADHAKRSAGVSGTTPDSLTLHQF